VFLARQRTMLDRARRRAGLLLTQQAREHVRAYLNYRTATWPTSINPHLFIHTCSWTSTRPVASAWIGKQLGMST